MHAVKALSTVDRESRSETPAWPSKCGFDCKCCLISCCQRTSCGSQHRICRNLSQYPRSLFSGVQEMKRWLFRLPSCLPACNTSRHERVAGAVVSPVSCAILNPGTCKSGRWLMLHRHHRRVWGPLLPSADAQLAQAFENDQACV